MENSCENIQEQIPELITGTLPAEKAAELQRHISHCPACSEYLEALQADDKLLGEFAKVMRLKITRLENNVIDVLDGVASKKTVNSVSIVSTNIKGPFIKLAVAVVMIIAILSVLNHFTGSFDSSTIVLAKALERMKQSSWVYSISETYSPQGKSIRHVWKSFDPHIDITKGQDGTIRYVDYSEKAEYLYNPNSNTITVSFRTDNYMLPGPKTPFETISEIIESAKDRKGKITRQKTRIDGIEVELIRIVYNDNPQNESTVLVREVKRNLLTKMEIKAIRPGTDKKFAVVTTFEYPEHGPSDIYTLGVPKDATIVDIRPEGPANALVELIQNKFEEGFGDYIAVVLQSWLEENGVLEPSSITVLRQKGNLKRSERYHAYNFQNRKPKPGTLYEDIKDNWPNLTILQILKLENDDALERRTLFDGKQTITLHKSLNGVLKKQQKRVDIFKLETEDSLAGLTWTIPHRQIMSGSSQMKRDIQLLPKDPNRPGLVGFRFLEFAQTDDHWFDPNKDYILIEYVSRQQGSHPFLRTIVTKTGRTPDGKWYPKVIRTKSIHLNSQGKTQSQSWEKHILLNTSPTFKEGIFDASSLTE